MRGKLSLFEFLLFDTARRGESGRRRSGNIGVAKGEQEKLIGSHQGPAMTLSNPARSLAVLINV
jgi:hypothetical protein